MRKSRMYMAETCAGYMGKITGKKRWGTKKTLGILREISLLLFVVLAVSLWQKDAAKGGNYVLPAVPDAVSELSGPEETPIPRNWSLQAVDMPVDSWLSEKEKTSYYAGPFGTLRKEPEEILVVLDPGHGGKDDGCTRGKVREKEVNLAISLKVQRQLQALGYQVLLTRDTDRALTLKERVETAEEAQADIFVSIHQNSSELSKVYGMELYYSAQNAETDSARLGDLVWQSALESSGAKARSIFEWEEFHVVRESRMPACLIETGFLTNASERRKLADPGYQEKLAEGIAKGIDQYFQPRTLTLAFGEHVKEEDLNEALNLLKRQNIRAMFFGADKAADACPEVLRRLTEEGHGIGICGSFADYQGVYENVEDYLKDLKESFEKIQAATGKAPELFASSEEMEGMQDSKVSEELLQNLEEKGIVVYDRTPCL